MDFIQRTFKESGNFIDLEDANGCINDDPTKIFKHL